MKYGWNPNNVGEKFIGDLIAAKMGDPYITFKQVSLLHTSSLVLAFSSIRSGVSKWFCKKTV